MSTANVKIYIWTYCPFCIRALQLLDSKGIQYEKIVLDGDDAGLAELRQKTGHRTVPQVFINDEFVGGSDDLAALDQSGALDKMLKGEN